MICPQCRSSECYRLHRGGVFDFTFMLVGLKQWRCHTCDRRFYGRLVAYSFTCYAHCPCCGNLNVDHISRERVDKGTLKALKRWLGVPAYRCDPCRERFFSTLPHRRIVPSIRLPERAS